ncbi:hypothetical protein ABG067_007970, partial [Albugo candida]
MTKKIIAFTKAMIVASHKNRTAATNMNDFNPLKDVPAPDAIFNYHKRKGNNIPVFNSSRRTMKKNDKNVTMYMNKPEEIIKLLMGNPEKGKQIHTLPDRTKNVRTSLNQGDKWTKNEFFQSPFISQGQGQSMFDLWVGDKVSVRNSNETFAISSFYTQDGITKFEGYRIGSLRGSSLEPNKKGVQVTAVSFDVSMIVSVNPYLLDEEQTFKSVEYDRYLRIDIPTENAGTGSPLNQYHDVLFRKAKDIKERSMKAVINGTITPEQHKLKVIIVPVNFFTDDTSGNQSKKWNAYDSWIMNFAAMCLKDRNKYENQYFVTTHHALSAVETAGPIVKNLQKLEKGVIMYSKEFDEKVLVFAPVLFISGDN